MEDEPNFCSLLRISELYVENFQPFQEEWFNYFLILLSQFNYTGSWMVHSEWELKYILGPRYAHSDYSFIRNLFEKLVELINSLEARWQTNIKKLPFRHMYVFWILLNYTSLQSYVCMVNEEIGRAKAMLSLITVYKRVCLSP